MPQDIRDVLNRRTDLSTFVVHLTRPRGETTAREALESILRDDRLRACTPMGSAKDQDDPADPAKQSQRVVCFSETPLEHVYSLVAEIWGRAIDLAPYGVAMTKLTARRLGVNPIWYVDMTPGRDWILQDAIEKLRDQAIANGHFHHQPIAKLTPLLEQMGTWPSTGTQKEFWWEREWRHVGDLHLPERGIIWLCPEGEMESIREAARQPDLPLLDPRWGLEQIIAHLAGFTREEITPFDPR